MLNSFQMNIRFSMVIHGFYNGFATNKTGYSLFTTRY